MKLRDLLDSGIVFEGLMKIQCWENECYPTIYYEGDDTITSGDWMDREIACVFPFSDALNGAGICIELAKEH